MSTSSSSTDPLTPTAYTQTVQLRGDVLSALKAVHGPATGVSVATVTEVHDAKPVPRGREAAVAVAAHVTEATQASLHLPQNHWGGTEGRGQKLGPERCGYVIVSDAGSPEVEGPLAQSLGQLSHQSLQAWTAGLPGWV